MTNLQRKVDRSYKRHFLFMGIVASLIVTASAHAVPVTVTMHLNNLSGPLRVNGIPTTISNGMTFVIQTDSTVTDTWPPSDFGSFAVTSVRLTAPDLGLVCELVTSPLVYFEDNPPHRAGLAPPALNTAVQVGASVVTVGVVNPNVINIPLPSFTGNGSSQSQWHSALSLTLSNGTTITSGGVTRTAGIASLLGSTNPPPACNTPPVCNAGGLFATSCAGATTGVSLNGSASSDPNGDTLSYAWTSNCPGGTFNNSTSATPTLTVGTSPGCNVSCSASLTVSDGKGGTSTCGAAVTITDSTGPVFSGVPATATAECNALPPTPGVTASDACSGSTPVTSSETIATGSCPGSFVLTRTWTAMDGCGNTTSTSADVGVMDTIDPILVGVPADVSAECDNVPAAATVTSSDTCDTAVPVTFAELQTSGSCPDEYTLTRSWTAVDDCGNDVTALQYVSVDDTKKPVLICPAGATLECPADTSIAANGSASASDNCATAMISSSDAVTLGCGSTKTITRTWSASDDCNNTSACDQAISVVDTRAPVLSVNTTPIHVVDTDCSGGEAVGLPSGTANDACDGTVAVTNDAPASFPAGWVTRVTYSASDACGNTGEATVDVAVDFGANIAITANRHTVGSGSHPGSTKEPLVGIVVCGYDKADGSCARVTCGGISHQHYSCIAATCPPTNCCTTDSTGACTINLPPGDYVVISEDATKTTLPDPLGVSASDLLCGEVKQKHLQQIVKATGTKVPGKTTVRTGSQLLIIEPEFVVWDATEQLYPFVFDSLGDWGVTATVAPPDGFVADHDALAAQVASTIAAVQFTITEVGSDLVPTGTTFEVTHKGRKEKIKSKVDIFLTSEYAKSRGFDPQVLKAKGLIKERPDNLGQNDDHGRRK